MAYPLIPERLQQFDPLICQDHFYVYEEDDCYFLWERVTGARYDQYPTNQLISNLQIPVECRITNPNRLYYKRQAIQYSAQALSRLIPADWRESSTFVPIPPSLIKSHPDHDCRLMTVLQSVHPRLADVRELVLQRENAVSKQKQISPEDRAANFSIDEECAAPDPQHLVVFDDMLAGGSHFRAMNIVLQQRFPSVRISGLFLARAIHPQVSLIGDLLM